MSLKEMVIYHELHHATQKRIDEATKKEAIGLQHGNLNDRRLFIEGQTQYIAEEVYAYIHQ